MGAADALIFTLLALVDFAFLALLRWNRGKSERAARVRRSLDMYGSI